MLSDDLQAALAGRTGLAGVYFEDLADGETLALHADEPFPGASVIKVPLLVEIMRRAAAGELDLAQTLHFPLNEDRFRETDSSGILTHLTSPVTLSLRDLCLLMIIESDNVATNALYDLAPDANQTLAGLGLTRTRLTHPIRDFPRLRADDANPVTAREIGALYRDIYHSRLPNSALMLEILTEQHAASLMPALLLDDETLVFAHKTGSVKGVLHDTGLILGPGWAAVLCLLSKRNPARVPAGQALAEAARLVVEYLRAKHSPPRAA
ncbi:MAG: serine hydrolase [Anaerolineales bacterium]|nr:serine hydrolase [Anaerolineales bacterium]